MRLEGDQRVLPPELDDPIVIPRFGYGTGHERVTHPPQFVAIQVVHEIVNELWRRTRPRADAVKQQLLEHEVVLEDFGGEVLSAEVSAKTGQGVPELLENRVGHPLFGCRSAGVELRILHRGAPPVSGPKYIIITQLHQVLEAVSAHAPVAMA